MMDPELRDYLDGMKTQIERLDQRLARVDERVTLFETRVTAKFDDVTAKFDDVTAKFDDIVERLLNRIESAKREAMEHTEVVETRLLSEFWKWARTADARYRQHHSEVTGLDVRVALLEDRVSDLERGHN